MDKYYFIGIKGAGMSALAQLLFDHLHDIKGCDYEEDYYTTKGLIDRGIPIERFEDVYVKRDSIIIVGSAFLDHPLVKRLRAEMYTIYSYSEYLGKLSKETLSIAISGTHGKTTTTNLSRQLLGSLERINVVVGDGVGQGNTDSEVFLFEACEYKRNFLDYHPKVAIITNIDYDHPDYYSDINDVKRAFSSFIVNSRYLIYNGDDENLQEITKDVSKKLSFGLAHHNDFYAENIVSNPMKTEFDVYCKGKLFGRFEMPLLGTHNVLNALASIALSLYMGVKKQNIHDALKKYVGSKRRFEIIETKEQIIISDYAHHPTEIKATHEALRIKYPHKQLICIFEPHTYSRTKQFVHEFKDALSLYDIVYLKEIFTSVREHEKTIRIEQLADEIENGKVLNDLETLLQYKQAVLIFMGAGNIDKTANSYINYINH